MTSLTPDRAYHLGRSRIYAELLRDGLWDIREKYIDVKDLPAKLLECINNKKVYSSHPGFQKLYAVYTSGRDIEKGDCDINMLCSILMNICTSLKAPRTGWRGSRKPPASDIEIADDIERIRIGCNTCMAHVTEASMSKDDFHNLVAEIRAIVGRIDMFLSSDKYMQGLDQIVVDCKDLSKFEYYMNFHDMHVEQLTNERENRVEIAEGEKETNENKLEIEKVKKETNENKQQIEEEQKETNEIKQELAEVITSGGYDETDTVRTTGHKPGPTASLAGYLKTEQDNTLSEDIHDAINLSLKSVGRLWLPNSFGTAFRVGSKYAMTNWHVIQGCVEPFSNKQMDFSNLERCKAHINFSGDPSSSDKQIFHISSIVPYFDDQLDIAVVELKTVNPPPALPLCTKHEECENVNKLKVLGFGHPKSEKKNEEFAEVIHPGSPRVKEAIACLQQNEEELKCKCRAMGKDPESFNWDYKGWDDGKNVAIDMYKEQGSSGSPAMICADATQVKVMAVVYRGLPDCFWESPDSLRPAFTTRCRIELAVKMSHIYESMKKNNLDLTKDVFQCGEEDMEL